MGQISTETSGASRKRASQRTRRADNDGVDYIGFSIIDPKHIHRQVRGRKITTDAIDVLSAYATHMAATLIGVADKFRLATENKTLQERHVDQGREVLSHHMDQDEEVFSDHMAGG